MRHAVVLVLVLAASLLTLVCAVGVAAMRDPYQRLHYVAPPTALAAPLLTLAVFLDEPQRVAGLKTAFMTIVLLLINAVVTHATARAVRVRARGHWQIGPDERIEAPPPEREALEPKEAR